MTRVEVLAILRPLVADSLAVDVENVLPESRLIDDLGADSLDFVDLVFLLEKKFGIRLHDGDLDFLTRLDFSSPTVMRDGFLTSETIEQLRPRLPALAEIADPARVTPGQLFSLLTVETLCRLVEAKTTAADASSRLER